MPIGAQFSPALILRGKPESSFIRYSVNRRRTVSPFRCLVGASHHHHHSPKVTPPTAKINCFTEWQRNERPASLAGYYRRRRY